MSGLSAAGRIDRALDRLYGYHGPAVPPSGLKRRQMLALPGLKPTSPAITVLKRYRVNQMPPGWPSANECVTAATIQGMNMVQDILADRFALAAMPHADLRAFAAAFDARGPWAWVTRPPATFPILGGMLLPQLAVRVLRDHNRSLRRAVNRGYRAELTTGNTPERLIENLRNGYPTSIHIAQPVRLFQKNGKWGDYRALFGGVPHTVSLAGYEPKRDTWLILDPAPKADKDYTRWDTPKLMSLWGRKFLFYPRFLSTRPAFAITTLIPDPE